MTVTTHFNVWDGAANGGSAENRARRLARQHPHLSTFHCLPVTSARLTERQREQAKRAGHRWVVGVYDKPVNPADRVRIPGLNA